MAGGVAGSFAGVFYAQFRAQTKSDAAGKPIETSASPHASAIQGGAFAMGDRMLLENLVPTMSSLLHAIERLTDRLDEDEMKRAIKEGVDRALERERASLQRLADSVKPPGE